jgi:hypothetical protein
MFSRADGALERQFGGRIVDLQRSATQGEVPQRRQRRRLVTLLLALAAAQIPIGAAILVLDQRDAGVVEFQALQHQVSGQQLRQHHGDMQPRQLDHVAAAGPGRIADHQVLHIDAGACGEQMHAQVSDRHGALDVTGNQATERSAQQVPIHESEREHQYGYAQRHAHGPSGPSGRPRASRPGILWRRGNHRCTYLCACVRRCAKISALAAGAASEVSEIALSQ